MEFAQFIAVPQVKAVKLIQEGGEQIQGALCLTGHHTIVSMQPVADREIMILHTSVDSLRHDPSPTPPWLIKLKPKDFQAFTIEFPNPGDCAAVAESIAKLSNIVTVKALYPFFYNPSFTAIENGWESFAIENEFSRLVGRSDLWRLSVVNKDFTVSSTYPPLVIVPKSVDDSVLLSSAQFRQGGRFPVLAYLHHSTNAALLRSSQPMVGMRNQRSKEDEAYLKQIFENSIPPPVYGQAANMTPRKCLIVDTRPLNNAKAQQQKGGGTEPEPVYSQWRRIHQNVDLSNAHQSLVTLVEALADRASSTEKFLSRLESSGWLSLVSQLLSAAGVVAQHVHKHSTTVLLHCDDGLDATPVVSALAQLILSDDCRTIRGFEALLEREFVLAGHPIQDRCFSGAHSTSKQHSVGPFLCSVNVVSGSVRRQVSPSMLLFLDCAWQVHRQFLSAFEFGESFLTRVAREIYFSHFGTFLCNNEQERASQNVRTQTVSLWSYLNRPEILEQYLNPLYSPLKKCPIWPSVLPFAIEVWDGLYGRYMFASAMSPQREAGEALAALKRKEDEIKSRTVQLRRQVAALEGEAFQKGLIRTEEPASP